MKNPSKSDAKSVPNRENLCPGVPQKGDKKRRLKKKAGPPNSAALLGAIFEENGLQDGSQNREKIHEKVIQNLVIFC